MYGYSSERCYTVEEIHRICIKNGWCGDCSGDKYEMLLFMVESGVSIERIALYISILSDNVESDEVVRELYKLK